MTLLSAGAAVLTSTEPLSAVRDTAQELMPISGVGMNLPRNWAFMGYNYQPEPMSVADLTLIARHARWVRGWANSLRDLCGVPQNVTAGPSGTLTWAPTPNVTALATTIERAATLGLCWWLPILDGVTTYRPLTTWNTRGRAEVMDFIAAFCGWWAARFDPSQIVFAAWNENPDAESTSPSHSGMLADADEAMRSAAPNHWAAFGMRSHSGHDGVWSVVPPSLDRRFLDAHNYDVTSASWMQYPTARIASANAKGLPMVYGEFDPSQSYTTQLNPYADPDGAAKTAALTRDVPGLLTAGAAAVGLWNDATGGRRCLAFTPATSSTPRSIAWLSGPLGVVRAANA